MTGKIIDWIKSISVSSAKLITEMEFIPEPGKKCIWRYYIFCHLQPTANIKWTKTSELIFKVRAVIVSHLGLITVNLYLVYFFDWTSISGFCFTVKIKNKSIIEMKIKIHKVQLFSCKSPRLDVISLHGNLFIVNITTNE